MSFEDGMSGSRSDADLRPIGYYTTIDDLVRVLEENEVEVSRRNCRANADFSQFNYWCVERAENRWPNCPFNVLVVQDDFGNFSVYSSSEHLHVGQSHGSDESVKESDERGSVLYERDESGYVASSPSESDGNGLTEARESSEAIVRSQKTNASLDANITGPQADKIHQRRQVLVGISRNLPVASPATPLGTVNLLLPIEEQSLSQTNKSDYHLFAKCNSNSDVNPILLRNHVMYSHQSSTDRTYWKCRLTKGCGFSILQQNHPNGTTLLYRSGEHKCEAHESLPTQSTSAERKSGSSRQRLKRVIAASKNIRLSHVRQPPASAFPSSRRPVDHRDDSTSPINASPHSTPLSTMAKTTQEGKTLAEVNQFLSERRLCWSSTFDDGATRIYSCRISKCPNEVEINLAHGKYTLEERGEHYHPAPESPANERTPRRNESEEVPRAEDMGPAGSIEQSRLGSPPRSLNSGLMSGTTSSPKQPNSVKDDETADGDAGAVSLDMHEVNSAHPKETAPVEVEDEEEINVPEGAVSEAGAEVQYENQPPEVVILSSDEEKSVDHGSDSDASSTTTASIDEEMKQPPPAAPSEDSVEYFRLSDKLPEIEEMAESMGLEIVDEGDTIMLMASEGSPMTTGRWLILKDADGDEVEVAEFVKRVFVRKQNWAKRGWDEFRIQFRNRCAYHFKNNDM